MNNQTSRAVSYAWNALAFLFLDARISSSIRAIYLYGSASRGELTSESDLDLFIDCPAEKEDQLEKAAKSACSRFYQSKDYEKWKQLDFTYPFSIRAGDLASWELKNSIMADGLVLYSKNPDLAKVNRQVLIIFELPKKKEKYLRFIRSLYGRKEKGYKEHGILKDLSGTKIGSNVILIPKENLSLILKFLNHEKINYSFKEIGIFE